MLRKINFILKYSAISLFILPLTIFSAYSQEMGKMNMDTLASKKKGMDMQNEAMLPMPFSTHMGIPLKVGTYNLRMAGLPTQNDGSTVTQYNFQFETGLSKTIGLFIGGEGLFNNTTLEAMFQFLAWKSKNGMNGASAIVEFEFPLGPEAAEKVYTLVGFSSTFSNSHIAFNQVLHYSPIENLGEGSVSFLYKASKRIYLISELSGVVQKGELPILNLLGGVKVRVTSFLLLGIGYRVPITTSRDFSSQYIIQSDMQWKK